MEYKFSELNEDTLRKLYLDFGFRAKEIGTIIGVTESAILFSLKKFKIPTNPRGYLKKDIQVVYTGINKAVKKTLTDDLLKEFTDRGMSDVDIGRMFNLTGEGVAYHRNKLGIKAKGLDYKRKEINHSRGLKDVKELTREELINELIAYRGIKGVARKYSTTFSTLKELINSYNLNRDSVLSDHINLTELHKKVIIGGLLGDGGIYDGGIRGFYYKESHSIMQIDYVKWKVSLLKDIINNDLYYEEKISELNTMSYLVGFRTSKYAELSFYRDQFYKYIEGHFIKTIPSKFIEDIDPLTFSIWFFDDGGLANNTLPYVCSGSSVEDIQKASSILNDKFGLDSYVGEKRISNCSLLYFSNIPKFFDLIKGYILPCFYYKIPLSCRFDIPELDSSVHKLPSIISEYTPQKWRDLPIIEKREWIDNVIKYYTFIGFPYYEIRGKDKINAILNNLNNQDIQKEVLSSGMFNKVSYIGTDLASAHFPHMWAAKIRGKRSVYNNYLDSKRFRTVIEKVFKYRNTLSEAAIRSELRHGSTVQNFKPLIAKTLYDIYCPPNGSVYDYSAGYGGRLLGACASKNVSTYTCTDPCQQTFFGLRKLQRLLNGYYLDKEIKIFNSCAEDPSFYLGLNKVDMCFSSPPYFDTEKYSEEDTQSYKRYPKIDQWHKSFLIPMINNCCNILKDGGYFLMNIADSGGYKLQKMAYEGLSSQLLYDRTILIRMPSYFSEDKYEPIFVFKKVPVIKNPSYEEITSTWEYESTNSNDIELVRITNKDKNLFSDIDKKNAIEYMQILYKENIKPSRNSIKNVIFNKFPYSVSRIEKAFGSWNSFLLECGIQPIYEAKDSVEHVKDYFNACIEHSSVLSFYEYEKATGHPSTRLKRLFNKDKKYHHLKENLQQTALNQNAWEEFFKNFID